MHGVLVQRWYLEERELDKLSMLIHFMVMILGEYPHTGFFWRKQLTEEIELDGSLSLILSIVEVYKKTYCSLFRIHNGKFLQVDDHMLNSMTEYYEHAF